MPHKNAVKGAAWERWCASFLGITRTLRKGRRDDRGDLDDAMFTYECKNDNSRSPLQWWQQAEAARQLDGKPWAVVLAKTACLTGKPKRPNEPAGWATMSIEQWKELRAYIGALEAGYHDSLDALRRGFEPSVGTWMAHDQVSVPRGPSPERASEPRH